MWFNRDGVNEVGRLDGSGAAEGEEMIGPVWKTLLFGTAPILQEKRVLEITAFGCLDIGKIYRLTRQALPFDIVLVMGDINAADRVLVLAGIVHAEESGIKQARGHESCQDDSTAPCQNPEHNLFPGCALFHMFRIFIFRYALFFISADHHDCDYFAAVPQSWVLLQRFFQKNNGG